MLLTSHMSKHGFLQSLKIENRMTHFGLDKQNGSCIGQSDKPILVWWEMEGPHSWSENLGKENSKLGPIPPCCI